MSAFSAGYWRAEGLKPCRSRIRLTGTQRRVSHGACRRFRISNPLGISNDIGRRSDHHQRTGAEDGFAENQLNGLGFMNHGKQFLR